MTTQSIIVQGRRWFQKSYGNTYHTASVSIGDESYSSDKTYGYGDQYIQTALELLHAHGHLLEINSPSALTIHCREAGIPYLIQVADVSRERDL